MNENLISQIARHFYGHYMKTGGDAYGWFPNGFKFKTDGGKTESFTYNECVKIMSCDAWRTWNKLALEVTA